VIEEADGTIYGDGVNIAARMEALAEGGGVCISSTVYDAVEGKLAFGFDFLGEQQVKNIAKPVRVYRVRAEPKPPSARPRSKRSMRWQIAVPALALILALGAVGAWLYHDLWVPASGGPAEGPALGSGPSIAVLPFVNLSGDAKQEYFSDGLTEDLITQLSRASRDLRVLARNTAFQYKGKAVDVSKLGRELGVRYVLEGSVQRTEDDLRVAAQLIDTQTGAHVWADRFDRKIADIFLVQDEIISQIVGEIAGSYGAIERNEANVAARKSPEQIEAYDLVLRARAAIQWDWTSETFGAARQALQQAIALDPTNSQARRELAWLGLIGWIFRVDATPTAPQDIIAEATKAVQLDPDDARARMVAAMGYFFAKQLDLFKREADQALALAPYDAELQATLGCMFSSMGDRQRGVALVTKANALNPDAAAGWYHSTIYTADYLNGDYRHALEVTRQNPQSDTFYAYIEYTPIYGQLGMKQDALNIWHKLQAQVPGASADTFANWWRLWNFSDEEVAKLMDGVHKSGVLEAEAKPGQ
jgi:TolB-like protein